MTHKKNSAHILSQSDEYVGRLIGEALRQEGLGIPQTIEEVSEMEHRLNQMPQPLHAAVPDPDLVFERMMNQGGIVSSPLEDDTDVFLPLAARISEPLDEDESERQEYQKFLRQQKRKRGR